MRFISRKLSQTPNDRTQYTTFRNTQPLNQGPSTWYHPKYLLYVYSIQNIFSCLGNTILISQVKVINETNLLNVSSIIFRVENLLFTYSFLVFCRPPTSPLLVLYLHLLGAFFADTSSLTPRLNEIKIFDPRDGWKGWDEKLRVRNFRVMIMEGAGQRGFPEIFWSLICLRPGC